MFPSINVKYPDAVKTFGVTWCVDETSPVVFENLGRTKPAYCTAESLPSREAAERFSVARSIPLHAFSETIRIPARTPIPMQKEDERSLSGSLHLSKIWLLRIDRFAEKGMRIDEMSVHQVFFRPPPEALKRHFDAIPYSTLIGNKAGEAFKFSLKFNKSGALIAYDLKQAAFSMENALDDRIRPFLDKSTAQLAAKMLRDKILKRLSA